MMKIDQPYMVTTSIGDDSVGDTSLYISANIDCGLLPADAEPIKRHLTRQIHALLNQWAGSLGYTLRSADGTTALVMEAIHVEGQWISGLPDEDQADNQAHFMLN